MKRHTPSRESTAAAIAAAMIRHAQRTGTVRIISAEVSLAAPAPLAPDIREFCLTVKYREPPSQSSNFKVQSNRLWTAQSRMA